MAMIGFVLLMAACAWIVFTGIVRPGGMVQLPVLLAVIYLLWLGPQFWNVIGDPTLPYGATGSVLFMAILCLAACVLGWQYGLRRGSVEAAQPLPFRTMIIAAVILTVFSAAVQLVFYAQPPEVRDAQRYTGFMAILIFLAQVRTIALFVSMLLFLRKRTPLTTALLLVNAAITVPVALVLLRRSELVEMAVAAIAALWFERRYTPPRILIIGGVLMATVFIFAVGPLRQASQAVYVETGERRGLFSLDVLSRVDFAKTVETSAQSAPDMRNAIYIHAYMQQIGQYAYGANVWNGLVRQYVPTIIFGEGIKDALSLGNNTQAYFRVNYEYGYRYSEGTTSTGFGTSFIDFWYLGSLAFGLIGYIMARLWRRAQGGGVQASAIYAALLPITLLSFTHGYEGFVIAAPFSVIIITGIFALARMIGPKDRYHENVQIMPRIGLQSRHDLRAER